jgi:ribosomal protein S18 acetylase RimI-like enzyme
MEIHLRPVRFDEVPELAQMNRMLIEDEGSDNPMSVDALAERITHWLDTDAYRVVIIERGEDIIGYVLYRQETDEYDIENINIFVRQYFVKRAYRRRGIGRTAFEQVVQSYFPPQATIVLEVLSSNVQGRSFWERLGFEPYYTAYRRPAHVGVVES